MSAAKKRVQVRAACCACRLRRTKCDGVRPCGPCVHRRIECQFTTYENATQRQTNSMRHAEVEQASSSNAGILRLMAEGDDVTASAVFQRLRAGEAVSAILEDPVPSSPDRPATKHDDEISWRDLWAFIMQSTASLSEASTMLRMTSSDRLQALPRVAAYAAIRNHMIGAEALLVDYYSPALQSHEPPGHQCRPDALPWAFSKNMRQVFDEIQLARARSRVDMNRNEETHVLLSLFSKFINAGGNLVLEGLVEASVQNVSPQSNPCQWNLISAIACCASTYVKAVMGPTFPPQRNNIREDFTRAVTAQINAQSNTQSSVADLQAMLILSFDAQLQGDIDRAISMLKSAIETHKSLPAGCGKARASVEAEFQADSYFCAAAGLPWLISLLALHGASEIDAISDLVSALGEGTESRHDSITSWTSERNLAQLPSMRGKPFLGARISLTEIHLSIFKLNDRLRNPIIVDLLLHEARRLAGELYVWQDGLPQDLQYSNTAPMHVFELQWVSSMLNPSCAYYMSVSLYLYDKTFAALLEPISRRADLRSGEVEVYRKDTWAATLQHCTKSAQNLRDFRKMWGLRIVPLVVVLQAWLTADILVRGCDPNTWQRRATWSCTPGKQACTTSDVHGCTRADSSLHALLEECFRCLVGGSVNVPLARVLLSRLSCTAQELKVELPPSVLLMLAAYDD